MGLGGNTLGLVFRIGVNGDKETQAQVAALRKAFQAEVKEIKNSGTDAFLSFGQSVGMSTQQMATFSQAVPAAGMAVTALVGTVTALAGIAIAAGAAFFELSKKTADAESHLWDLHTKTDFAVETLSGLGVAAKRSGSDIDKLVPSLMFFQKGMEKSAESTAKTSDVFKKFHIDTTDNEKALRQVFDQLNKLPDGAQKTGLAMQFFGRSGKDLLGVLRETNGNLDDFIKKAEEMGLIVSTKSAKAADDFRDSLKTIEGQLAGMTRMVADEVIPVFTSAMGDVSTGLKNNQSQWKAWGQDIAIVCIAVEGTILGLGKTVAQFASGFMSVFPFLKGLTGTSPGGGSFGSGFLSVMPGGGNVTDAIKQQAAAYDAAVEHAWTEVQAENWFGKKGRTGQADKTPHIGGGRKKHEESPEHVQTMKEIADEKAAIAGIEAATQVATDALKHAYQERLIAFTQYIAGERAENEKRKSESFADISLEQGRLYQSLQAKTISQKEFNTANTALLAQATKVNEEGHKKNGELDQEEYKERLRLLKEFRADLEAINRAHEEAYLATIKDATTSSFSFQLVKQSQFLQAEAEMELNRNLRKKQALQQEIDDIIAHVAQVYKISLTEAAATKIVTDAVAERKLKFELIENERVEIARRTAKAIIDAANAEAITENNKQAGNADATGSRPRRVIPTLNPMTEAMKLVNVKFGEGTVMGKTFAATLGAIDQAAQGVASAVGDMVKSFILMGSAAGSFRKMAAEVVASIAQQAIVQSIYQGAMGLAWEGLFWFTGNPKYQEAANFAFGSAVAFGLVGGVAAVAARSLAGNSFSQSASGGASSGAGASTGSSLATASPAPIDVGRRLGSAQQPIHIVTEIKIDTPAQVKNWIKAYNLNQHDLRNVLLSDGRKVSP
jgi:hypothetical protein